MAKTKVPGIKAHHRIITDTCRQNKGPAAIDEALASAREELGILDENWDVGKGVKLHVVVTVERPDR